MKRNLWFFLPGLLALLALSGAYTAEYGFGLLPCNLCLYQRVPYFLVLLLTVIGIRWKQRLVLLRFMAILLISNAGIALYHVGIEQHWWVGLKSCEGGGALIAGSIEELQVILTRAAKTVRCDQPAWSFHGITFAGLNVLFASACAVLAACGGRHE